MMSAMKHSKNILRKQIKERLKAVSVKEKESQSCFISKKLFELPEYKNSNRISIFLSMSDEIQTNDILKDALQKQKMCYIPRYDSSSNFMDMVRIKSWEEFESLPETKWKIKQPPLDEERETALASGGLDLILIPGLAFTTEGYRLGRGRGYYDTYLTRCIKQQEKAPVTIALAFKEQIMPEIPMEETDVPINIVLY